MLLYQLHNDSLTKKIVVDLIHLGLVFIFLITIFNLFKIIYVRFRYYTGHILNHVWQSSLHFLQAVNGRIAAHNIRKAPKVTTREGPVGRSFHADRANPDKLTNSAIAHATSKL